MFYKLKNELIQSELQAYNNKNVFVGCLYEDEFNEANDDIFHFSKEIMQLLHHKQIKSRLSKIDAYPDSYIGEVVILNNEKTAFDQSIVFLIKKNLFLLLSNDSEIHNRFDNVLKEHDPKSFTLERLIFLFFDSQIQNDTIILDSIQKTLSDIDEKVFKNKTINFNVVMEKPRKQVRLLDHTYDHLLEIAEELVDNELEFFDRDTRYFKIMKDRFLRLHNSTSMMQEFINTIRESHQFNTDNDLNSTMKLLTVITAIFQPLTLIVGWYGMNFSNMPELGWEYGYVFVIILSIMSIILCYWIFKKKKMF